MQNLEFAILNWIQLHCRDAFADAVLPAISAVCNYGEIWILLALVLVCWKKHRRTGIVLAVALILDLLCCNLLLKPLVARIRPCDVNTAIQLLIPHPLEFSFPSGHSAASFAAVGALKASGSRLWIPAFVLASVIAFSRLYLYVHWPSDVLGGALLGIVLGFAAEKLVRCLEKRKSPERE